MGASRAAQVIAMKGIADSACRTGAAGLLRAHARGWRLCHRVTIQASNAHIVVASIRRRAVPVRGGLPAWGFRIQCFNLSACRAACGCTGIRPAIRAHDARGQSTFLRGLSGWVD
ncbi:hypothetical protein Acidovoranil_23230 [Acidovorax sp. FG27]